MVELIKASCSLVVIQVVIRDEQTRRKINQKDSILQGSRLCIFTSLPWVGVVKSFTRSFVMFQGPLFSFRRRGLVDQVKLCVICWKQVSGSPAWGPCFKTFVSSQPLWQCFAKTFLCLNTWREGTFFLGRVEEHHLTGRRLNFLQTSIIFLLSSSLLPPGSSHSERTPHPCAFICAVASSFLVCPAACCSYDKAPVQWHFLSEVCSDPQAALVTSPLVLPLPFQVSPSCQLHCPTGCSELSVSSARAGALWALGLCLGPL